jgi:hypothetical protein
MLGDTQVTLPSYEATLGVTINTAPAAIWPWLMQMGYRRDGLYSYCEFGFSIGIERPAETLARMERWAA